MKTSLIGRLRRKAEQFQKRFASKSLILMYHRIAEVDLDPWALCVTPQHFAEHLEILQKSYQPLSLKQLLQHYQDGTIPQQSVVITFDDGYVDNCYHAQPLLERYGIPATIFVSTGYLEGKREFWWDELEQLLLKPKTLPEELSLSINDSVHHWKLNRVSQYSQAYRSDFNCKAWEAKPGSRTSLYYSVWQVLRLLGERERMAALDELAHWANVEPTVRETYRPLCPDEVYRLAQEELIEIGAHTITHPFLSAQPPATQNHEIQQSKADLAAIINRPVTSFSYPFGSYSLETVELVRNAKLDCACSTSANCVWKQSDRFQLPRVAVKDWNGEEFFEQLLRWFDE